MRTLILAIFLFLSSFIQASENESPYIISLETAPQLVPVYLNSSLITDSKVTDDYKKEAYQILLFDLDNSGLIQVMSKSNPLDAQAKLIAEGKNGPFQGKDKPAYFIIPKIEDTNLSVILYSTNHDWTKKFSVGALTLNIKQDRAKFHLLSDEIHKVLFGKSGIATTKIIYTLRSTGKNDWVSDIYEMDYDGSSNQKLLRDEGYIVTPQYVPPAPGKKSGSILYVSYKNGIPKIYFASLIDGKTSRFTKMNGNQLMPTMNRDRTYIAFVSDVTGNPDLFLAPFNGNIDPNLKPFQLFSSKMGVQGTPAFSPDGRKLAFVSNKDGSARIYIAEIPEKQGVVKGQMPELLTRFRRNCTAPSWSPDGTKIAYCSPVEGVHQIFCYDLRTGEETQVTTGSLEKQNPSFAPNSLHLVYNSSNGFESDLYIINLNQKKPVKISSGSGEKRFPHWEPRN